MARDCAATVNSWPASDSGKLGSWGSAEGGLVVRVGVGPFVDWVVGFDVVDSSSGWASEGAVVSVLSLSGVE